MDCFDQRKMLGPATRSLSDWKRLNLSLRTLQFDGKQQLRSCTRMSSPHSATLCAVWRFCELRWHSCFYTTHVFRILWSVLEAVLPLARMLCQSPQSCMRLRSTPEHSRSLALLWPPLVIFLTDHLCFFSPSSHNPQVRICCPSHSYIFH